jgi:hypothetical protein
MRGLADMMLAHASRIEVAGTKPWTSSAPAVIAHTT